jgi:hypothetical protein
VPPRDEPLPVTQAAAHEDSGQISLCGDVQGPGRQSDKAEIYMLVVAITKRVQLRPVRFKSSAASRTFSVIHIVFVRRKKDRDLFFHVYFRAAAAAARSH